MIRMRNTKSHAEWRVRRETAMFLIDPADYVQAEREYDGEIYQMSCEMDVTVFLLEELPSDFGIPPTDTRLKRGDISHGTS